MKVVSFLFALLCAATAAAQEFPSKTVRLVSGVTPGSASDTMARIVAEKLTLSLGQPVIVENRLGAGGFVGAKYVATAEPDGHTIMMYASAFTVSTLLHSGLDPKDLAPVATVATIPTVLVTAPDRGYKDVADLVARAKADPDKVVCATAGVGSATHMNLERFRFSAGIEVLKLHMKGAPDALGEVIAGRADCYFALSFQAQKMGEAGKVKVLAVGSPKRSAMFPSVPTTVELGYAESDYNFWIGALISSKTPRAIIERLHREMNAIVSSPEVNDRIRKLGADPLSLTLAEFDAMIAAELESNARLIKQAKISAN